MSTASDFADRLNLITIGQSDEEEEEIMREMSAATKKLLSFRVARMRTVLSLRLRMDRPTTKRPAKRIPASMIFPTLTRKMRDLKSLSPVNSP
jgi:hypothetical protein